METNRSRMQSFLKRFKRKTKASNEVERSLPLPVAAFVQSFSDGSLTIGDEYRTTFFDYQPCRIVSVVKRTTFGREDNRFVVSYNDKKGKEQKILISPDDYLVKNEILVREFKTLYRDYEQTLDKAWSLANKLWALERRLRRYPITEEEVTALITPVVNS